MTNSVSSPSASNQGKKATRSSRRTKKRNRPPQAVEKIAAPEQQRPHEMSNNRRGFVAAAIMALCALNILDVDIHINNSSGGGRRSLLSTLYLSGPSTLLPWAEHHLVDVTDRPDPEAETALFWHIPKSGGTTAKRLYQCMGRTLAHRVGSDPRFGHDKEDEIVVFEPHQGKDWKVVNVDTTIKPGIIRAKKLGLVQSHTTDLIFTMEPQFAGQELYDINNKGRFVALFRHPVDRALSMFYYLQTATWERTYRPEWANMTVMEWASLPNAEEDYMVHKLVGKSFGDTVDETDLIVAKELVRQRFIVGLMVEMNESIRRFNIVLGVDEDNARSKQCMKDFGLVDEHEKVKSLRKEDDGGRKLEEKTHATDNKNSNKHPKFEEGSPEFEAVASRNRLDILLYKYVETLFESQKDILDSYLLDEELPGDLGTDLGEARKQRSVLLPRDDVTSSPVHPASGNPGAGSVVAREIGPEVGHKRGEVGVGTTKKSSNLSKGLKFNLSVMESTNNPKGIGVNLAEVNEPVKGSDSETPFFWHVPKSGGTTLQRLYWCMGFTIANEVGTNPKFGEYQGELSKLAAFSPWKDNPGKVVNVDVSTHEGILEARNRGFLTQAGQPHVDVVATSEFQFASLTLFSPKHKARMFALFRHPIDRAVSKFYYLQKATWEPTYNTKWAKMTLEEWASRDRGDNNWMVRHLVGKNARDDLTSEDLDTAKEIVRSKFIVGLMDKFEESVHRFNLLLGVDEGDPQNEKCIEDFSSNGGDSHAVRNADKIVKKNEWNSYAHPEAERGSPAWVSLAKVHMYDNLLYRHVVEMFAEQRPLFELTTAAS